MRHVQSEKRRKCHFNEIHAGLSKYDELHYKHKPLIKSWSFQVGLKEKYAHI